MICLSKAGASQYTSVVLHKLSAPSGGWYFCRLVGQIFHNADSAAFKTACSRLKKE